MKKSRIVIKFDPYAPWWLIVAIVFWLCSIHTAVVSLKIVYDTAYSESYRNILSQNIYSSFFFCILTLDIIYDLITTKGYSKHELA